MGDAALIDQLTPGYRPVRSWIRFGLITVALAAGVIALMNPRRPGRSENNSRKGIDLAIAIDVSKSMLATDLAPSRLERARQLVLKLMDAMPEDRIALVLFAGKAWMQMPLTNDHLAAAMYVRTAGPDAIPQQGTVISDALNMSAGAFAGAEKRFKAILLISDGEDHDEGAVRTAGELSEEGVMINTVGVGSPEGAVIIDPATGTEKKDEAGNTVITRLNEQTLEEIATKTNGIYVRLQSSDEAVKAIMGQLSQIERKAYGDRSLIAFTSYYAWFAVAMLLLIIAEWLIPDTISSGSPKLKTA